MKRDLKRPFLLMMQHKAPHGEWSPAFRRLDYDRGRKYPEPVNLFDDCGQGRGVAWRDQDMTLEKTPKKQ